MRAPAGRPSSLSRCSGIVWCRTRWPSRDRWSSGGDGESPAPGACRDVLPSSLGRQRAEPSRADGERQRGKSSYLSLRRFQQTPRALPWSPSRPPAAHLPPELLVGKVAAVGHLLPPLREKLDEPAIMRQEQGVEVVIFQDRCQQCHGLAVPGHDDRRIPRGVDVGAQSVFDLRQWRDLHGSNFSLPTNSCSLTLRADREDDDQTLNPVDIVEDQKAVPGTTTQLPRGSDHRLAKKRLAVRRGRVRFKDQVVLDHPPNQRVVLALDRLYVVARQHVEDD